MTTTLTLYGSPTCADTARARQRLQVLGVPVREIHLEAVAGALPASPKLAAWLYDFDRKCAE